MFFVRLHKWLLGLALIASITSYNGYISNAVGFNSNNTELLIETKPVVKTASFCFSIIHSNLKRSSEFSFKTLLNTHNSTINLQFDTLKEKRLQYVSYIQFKALKHSINQGDYHKIFIG